LLKDLARLTPARSNREKTEKELEKESGLSKPDQKKVDELKKKLGEAISEEEAAKKSLESQIKQNRDLSRLKGQVDRTMEDASSGKFPEACD